MLMRAPVLGHPSGYGGTVPTLNAAGTALVMAFLTAIFLFGLALVVYADRVLDWSERTFSPSLRYWTTRLYGSDYRPTGTPRPARVFARWFLRFAGVFVAVGSGWVLYFIITSVIRYVKW